MRTTPLRRFRVALAVLVSRGNASLKVKRLQFVRPTKSEAETAAAEQLRGSAGYFNMTGSEASTRDTYSAFFSARRHRTD